MAELGPEGLDDFQDRIDELGDYLFTTLTNSVEAAAQSINFNTISTNLTAELTKGLNNVSVDKILTDKLLKDAKVQKVMADVQKKFEDGVGKIDLKVNDIQLGFLYDKFQPSIIDPINVRIKYVYDKFKPPIVDPIHIGVKYAYDKLTLPKPNNVQVPVEFLYDKFQLPKSSPVNVAVKYAYDKFVLPKTQDVDVYVKYIYDKFKLPKLEPINVPVEYNYDDILQPSIEDIQVPVSYEYEKFKLPKSQGIDVLVSYAYSKFQLPKASPILVNVKYAYEKFIQPKSSELSVPVNYEYDSLQLPKNQGLSVGVSYDYTPFKLPITNKDKSIDVVVDYLYSKFSLPKSQPIKVPVSYVYDKFVTPKAQSLSVPIDYEYDKLVLPSEDITVPVSYKYDKLALPKIKPIDVFVNYISNKLVAPKIDNIKIPVNYVYDSFKMPKVGKLEVPVTYSYDKLTLPKTPGLDILVDYVYGKFELPKNQQLDVEVGYSYESLKLPKAALSIPVEYVYDKFNLPTTKDVSVPVKYLYDKFALPKEQLQVPVNYLYSKLQLPKEKLTIPVSYQYDKFNLPKSSQVDVAVSYLYDKFNIPKPEKLKVGVGYVYDRFVEPAIEAIKIPVNYIYEQFTQPVAKPITIPVKYVYDKLKLPVADSMDLAAKVTNVNIEEVVKAVDKISPIELQANITTKAVESIPLPTIDTTPLEKAGDLVKRFVDLTSEANKKKQVSLQLYNDIVAVAEKLVVSRRMEKSAVDEIVSTLQQKIEVPSVKLGAKVGEVNTTEIDKALDQYQPVQLSSAIDPGALTSIIKNAILKAVKDLNGMFSGIETDFGDALAKGFARGKVKIKEATLLDTITAEIIKYEKAQEDAVIKGEILALMAEERVSSERAALMVALKTEKQKLSSLANQQASLIVELNKSKAIASSVGSLEEVAKLQEEITQAQSDLSGYKNQIVLLDVKGKKLDSMITSQESLTAAAAEEKRIREKISAIYEKHFDSLNKIKSVSAQVKDIFNSKGVALATLAASAAILGERLVHAMHDFKEAGMDSATAVQASINSLSIKSIMGLSDTVGVTKQLVSEFGSLNVLTNDQVDTVGQLAHNNGLAGAEATNMIMAMSRMPGMTREAAVNSEEMFKSIGKAKGVIPAQIMKEVAKNSNLMATYSKGGAKGFAEAAASAKKMGVELSNMLNAARKTLDFESSLTAQMEASAMLGKEINLDRLRQAALSGDANAVLREQTRLMKEAGGLENMNVLQKEALANAMGLQVDEMVKISEEAKYQEDHFGEQAGFWAKILGYSAKYGEGLIKGLTTIAPLATGLASIMSILNIKSFPGLVSSTWNMVRGLTAGVVQAGLLLAKLIAIGATKLFGDKDQVSKVKSFFGEKSSELVDKIKGKKPELPKPEATISEAGPADQAKRISKLNTGDLLKGAAALVVTAAGVFVFAKAVQELAKVEDWKRVAIGLGLFAASMFVLAKVLGPAAPEIAIASLALIPFGLALMMFAEAISIAAPAITMLGAAFGSFVDIVGKNMGAFVAVALGLPLLAAGIMALGVASLFALPAAGALMLLGIGIGSFGKVAETTAPGILAVASSLANLSTIKADNFGAVGDGLLRIAKGLGAIALTGLAAVPVLMALSKFGMVSSLSPESTTIRPTPPESKAISPTPTTAIAAAPPAKTTTAAAVVEGTQPKQTQTTPDISALMAKIDALTKAISGKEVVLKLDGSVLAKSVLFNMPIGNKINNSGQ